MLARLLRRLFGSRSAVRPRAVAPAKVKVDTLVDQAMARFHDSNIAAARELLDRHIAENPRAAGPRLRRAALLPAIVQSMDEIDEATARFERELDEIAGAKLEPLADPPSEVGLLPFFLAYYERDCRPLLEKFCSACARFHAPAAAEPKGSGARRPRVGFVSTFFHGHSVGRTTFGLVADLPREHFEVWVFAIAPNDDPWSRAYRQYADSYVHLSLDLAAARRAIAEAKLDVLVFADLGMHPFTYFLAFSRLARLQLTTWGHPVTSGMPTIDRYVSAASLETAGAERRYRERLLRPPGYFMPRYQKPEIAAPRPRAELGLPQGRHLYCCPQSPFKLHLDFDATLRSILERDPEGEVVLLESRPGWAAQLRRRFARSLGPVAERVRFVPPRLHHDFLHLLAAADVLLDPFYFGGCNTSIEALGLGVPVVTLPGARLPGRFTVALYEELGLADCVADSPARYVDLAVRLGTDEEFRRGVSGRIRERNDRLFQRPDTAQALGAALLELLSSPGARVR